MKVAVLIEVNSIQSYIFTGSKLKENAGASKLIGSVLFGSVLSGVLNDLGLPNNVSVWIGNQDDQDSVIGFIGGGNALLYLKSEDQAMEFKRQFSMALLLKLPGLSVSIASLVLEGDLDYTEMRSQLSNINNLNKSLQFSLTAPLKHGISSPCPHSHLAADTELHEDVISTSSAIRLSLSDDREYGIAENHIYPTEFQQMGQKEEKSFIAVVHIDGNGIGQLFRECVSLEDTQSLSTEVIQLAEECMKQAVDEATRLVEKLKPDNAFEFTQIEEKTCIPLRPILVGGDDITFVCDGRIGIYMAEYFVRSFNDLTSAKSILSTKGLSACAGVAITKTTFPFFKGYQLAEELCQEAKRKSRTESQVNYWVAHSGIHGTLKDLIKSKHRHDGKVLRHGPRTLNELNILKDRLLEFHKEPAWSRKRIMELRTTISQGEGAFSHFKSQAAIHGVPLDQLKNMEDAESFYDAIELLDFYPTQLLNPT